MNIKITGVKKLADKRKHAADKLQGKRGDPLKRAVHLAGTAVEKQAKLHLTGGNPLYVRTGRLRASVNTQTTRTGKRIKAEVGTNVSYGIKHEFGIRVKKRPWLGPALHKKEKVIHRLIDRAVHRIMANG